MSNINHEYSTFESLDMTESTDASGSSRTMFVSRDTHNETKGTENVPQAVKEAVFVPSVCLPKDTPVVKGYNWDEGLNYSNLLQSFATCGIQATNFGLATKEVNEMITYRNKDYAPLDYMEQEEDEFIIPKTNLTIFLGYTSNMVTSGTRETIRFLVKNKMVDCIVTTAGGVEEDFIKCLASTYVGNFHVDDRKLRDQGINRAGNLFIPNENYCSFETWVTPILDKMVEEQKTNKITWTPSKMITRLGKEIDNEESIYYWAAVNKIPVFCPALTDGSLGDMIYFHSFRNPGLILDIVQDLKRINTMAVRAKHTGMIILGGGVVKHHICNANLMVLKALLMGENENRKILVHLQKYRTIPNFRSLGFRQRNGADFSVYINTASDYDASDSGARPEEAISWGKIKKTATPVKVYGDASILFPLLVAETFAKQIYPENKKC